LTGRGRSFVDATGTRPVLDRGRDRGFPAAPSCVLDPATYTIVAIVTSTIAPPVLRRTLARLDPAEEERHRKLEHDSRQVLPGTAVAGKANRPRPK
jgi:hypothetical protein